MWLFSPRSPRTSTPEASGTVVPKLAPLSNATASNVSRLQREVTAELQVESNVKLGQPAPLTPAERRIHKVLIEEKERTNNALQLITAAILQEEQERVNAIQELQKSVDRLCRRLDSPDSQDALIIDVDAPLRDSRDSTERINYDDKILATLNLLEEHKHQVQSLIMRMDALEANARPVQSGVLATDATSDATHSLDMDRTIMPSGMRSVPDLPQLEPASKDQAIKLRNLGSCIIDLHASQMFHSIRACRCALRAPELSKEERASALRSLNIREKFIRDECAKIDVEAIMSGQISLSSGGTDAFGTFKGDGILQQDKGESTLHVNGTPVVGNACDLPTK